MKTAVIYARYSSNSQTEQSIEGQLNVCNKFAQDNGLYIVDTYIDRAMTGTNDNRPAFQQMLTDSERGKWDIVLVYAIDRFGRNSTDIAINKYRLKKNGKILLSATQKTSDNLDGTTNLDGIILEQVYIGMAEYYSKELAQKVSRGLHESRKKGQFCGGSIPYGYYVKDKRVHIDEEKAKTVIFIYEQYALSESVPRIIVKLNEKGLLHDGKPFIPNCVYSILRNEKYTGVTKVHDEVFDIFPRIVPQELFEKVRRRIANNRYGRRGVTESYLLRNKVRCGYCGNPISAECGTSKHGKQVRYYKCRGRKKLHNGCEKSPIRKEALEKFVIENMIETLTSKEEMQKIIKWLMEVQETQSKNRPIVTALEREKHQIENALNNIMRAIEEGITSNTTNKRLHELEARQEELEKELVIEKSKTALLLTEEEIRAFYEKALKLEIQELVNYLLEEVTLYDDKIIIRYKSATKNGSDESQGFSFYMGKTVMPIIILNKNDPIYVPYEVIKVI